MSQQYKFLLVLGLLAIASSLFLARLFTSKIKAVDLQSNEQEHLLSSTQNAQQLATSWSEQGASRAINGDYQGAIADYNRALRLNPSDADTYYNRGVAYYYLEQQSQAQQDFNHAIRLNPDLAEAYGNRGQLRLEQGNRQGAIQDFQQAAQLFEQQGELEAAQLMQSKRQELQRTLE